MKTFTMGDFTGPQFSSYCMCSALNCYCSVSRIEFWHTFCAPVCHKFGVGSFKSMLTVLLSICAYEGMKCVLQENG